MPLPKAIERVQSVSRCFQFLGKALIALLVLCDIVREISQLCSAVAMNVQRTTSTLSHEMDSGRQKRDRLCQKNVKNVFYIACSELQSSKDLQTRTLAACRSFA